MGEPAAPLTDVRAHFSFGENWASYARLIDEAAISEAMHGLTRLLGVEVFFADARFSTWAVDRDCTLWQATAGRRTRHRARPRPSLRRDRPSCSRSSRRITQLDGGAPQHPGSDARQSRKLYDIVYSWGVLHHTGDLREALLRTAALVKVDGAACGCSLSLDFVLPDLANVQKVVFASRPYSSVDCAGSVCPLVWLGAAGARTDAESAYRKLQVASRHGLSPRRARSVGRISLRVGRIG